MTYKHTSLWDSELGRSLEKIAIAKGLVKPEVLQKQASVLDLSPSPDLMDNIFKLCTGLRAEGLTKEANEVETFFLKYKRAQTLYQAHLETGEDVVHSAHPKGSHHLVDVDGEEATVEDILDKHTKIVKMIEKMPTGKLSSAKQIMQAVKIALASPQDDLRALTHAIRVILSNVQKISNKELTMLIDVSSIQSLLSSGTVYTLESAKSEMQALSSRLAPPLIPGTERGLSAYTWTIVKPKLEKAFGYLNQAINIVQEMDQKTNETQEKEENVPLTGDSKDSEDLANPVEAKISELKNQIIAWKTNANVASQPAAGKWIDAELEELDKIFTSYKNIPTDQVVAKLPILQARIAKEVEDINKFKQLWVK